MRIPVKYHPLYLLTATLCVLSQALWLVARRLRREPLPETPRPVLGPGEAVARDARIARPILLAAAGSVRRAG